MEDDAVNAEISAKLVTAADTLAELLESGPLPALEQAHARLGERFLASTQPRGRRDNTIEQRILGTLWAELEEALDARRANGTHGAGYDSDALGL